MDYSETLQYLFAKTPVFQRQGASAYKPGLGDMLALDEYYGHPHRAYKTIHVAGTNGKGSTSHTLAAILQSAGYKVGLYTSPHLVDFSERVRVNGSPVDPAYVTRFVEEARPLIESIQPSFFEITTIMAFRYFRDCGVDAAVVEVGLGGRLDSTNVITPCLSVITNISLDHVNLLGDTVEKIAVEKAGIIKPGVPVVVGEASPSLRAVFNTYSSDIVYAEDLPDSPLDFELKGLCQSRNKKTILASASRLGEVFDLPEAAVREGLSRVVELTGLMGRWQTLPGEPPVTVDTGHNEGGIRYIAEQLRAQGRPLRVVFGMVSDKDVRACLALMPAEATYYFCNAAIPRALPADRLREMAAGFGLRGRAYPSVKAALSAAKADYCPGDFIFAGGSNFTVAEVLV